MELCNEAWLWGYGIWMGCMAVELRSIAVEILGVAAGNCYGARLCKYKTWLLGIAM